MKKLIPLLVLASSTCLAASSSSFSISAEADYYAPSGTPGVGDVGWTMSKSVERFSPVVALDYDVTGPFTLELGYRHTPDLTAHKQAPTPSIFPSPPGTSVTQVVTPYNLTVRRDDVFLGAFYRLHPGSAWTLALGVFGSLEMTRTQIAQIPYLVVNDPLQLTPPVTQSVPQAVAWPYSSRATTLRPGAVVRISYALGSGFELQAEYTFLDSSIVRGSYLGAGLSYRF